MWDGALGIRQGGATHFTTLWLCEEGGLREGTIPLPGFWLFAWHLPISGHFTYFLYVTGTLPAVALVLNPRVNGFTYILRPHGPFKWSLLEIQQFLPSPQPPLVLQPHVMGIYVPGPGTLYCVVWPGAGIAHSQGIPPDFYLPHMNVGSPVPAPPPLHATCLCLSTCPYISASLTCLDECVLFKSLIVQFPYRSIF